MMIFVPSALRLWPKWFKVQRQKDSKACTSYSMAHCLQLMSWFWRGLKVDIDAMELRHHQLLYLKRDKMKSISYEEGFELLNLVGFKGAMAKPPAIVRRNKNNLKRWLTKRYPIMLTILTKKQLHAVCCIGYDEDVFYVADSLKGRVVELTDFDSIKEAYICFLKHYKTQ